MAGGQITARATELKLGNGLDPGVKVGPLVSTDQLVTVGRYVKIGQQEGAELIVGVRGEGRGIERILPLPDYPTVSPEIFPEMRIAREEILGPVLSVIPVDGLDTAISICNSVNYGLSAASSRGTSTRPSRQCRISTRISCMSTQA